MLKRAGNQRTPPVMILDSPSAILALSSLLESFAEYCGQAGAMHWLPYFLDKAVLGRRSPKLVLVLHPEESQTRSLLPSDLRGAALFFEYQVLGLRTGVIATGDAVGFNSVIAPDGERGEVAAIAARALLQSGATTVLATYEGHGEPEVRSRLNSLKPAPWAVRERVVHRMLRLAPTLDETLLQMGKATRTNLRRYRRRLEAQIGCEYIADAAPFLANADLQAINAKSLNPVCPEEFKRRVGSASSLRGSFLSGLRAANGDWISLMGGWRQGGTTVVHWQTNLGGLEKFSVGTVMRSYFFEDEIARGAEQVLLFGGTPHSMRNAFATSRVADLVMKRPGLRPAIVRVGTKILFKGWSRIRPNFVARTIYSPEWTWHRGTAAQAPPTPLVWRPASSHRAA